MKNIKVRLLDKADENKAIRVKTVGFRNELENVIEEFEVDAVINHIMFNADLNYYNKKVLERMKDRTADHILQYSSEIKFLYGQICEIETGINIFQD